MSKKATTPKNTKVAVAPKPKPAPKPKTPKWEALPIARVAWVADHARPAVSPCLCGCGGTTKGRFMPGHDATLKEALKATLTSQEDGAAEAARLALEKFGW